MRITRRGFTLIEVALFLAVTGALFVGIIMGVQNSMYQQRYNDSVQNFAEFLRSIYSQVSNPQNSIGDGRSNKAIYGKLVVFGETYDFNGGSSEGGIYSYDVVGDVKGTFSGDLLDQMRSLNFSVMDDNGQFAGNIEEYKPRWEASIQQADKDSFNDFEGAILVVRHPQSGTIFTLVYDSGTIDINTNDINTSRDQAFKQAINDTDFHAGQIDFCINPNGNQPSDSRRNIRIISNARNASGVEVIDMNSDENKCNK